MNDWLNSIFSGRTFLWLLTAGCGLLILSVLGFMIFLGWPLFTADSFNLLRGPVWAPDQHLFGIFPFICGTLAIVILSLLIAFPLSLGNAVLINQLLPPLPAKLFYRMVKLMTGIPTVIYGFVGISLLVPLLREWSASGSGMSLLSAALLLALLISPTMILIFVESFAAIPQPYLNAIAALGGNFRQKLFYIILPGARNGIMTGLPLGLGVGVYLAEYAGKPAKALFSLIFDLLAGVPSIVIGLFGFSVTIYLHRHFSSLMPCLLISGMSLALLILPYLVRTTQSSLEELPAVLRLTAFALGAEKSAVILSILMPQALPGIFSGVVLAIGRAAEDTAVIMLTGVVASAGVPRSLFDNFEALPFYIYHMASQFSDQHELQQGIGAALVLLIVSVLLFTGAGLLRRKATHHLLFQSK